MLKLAAISILILSLSPCNAACVVTCNRNGNVTKTCWGNFNAEQCKQVADQASHGDNICSAEFPPQSCADLGLSSLSRERHLARNDMTRWTGAR